MGDTGGQRGACLASTLNHSAKRSNRWAPASIPFESARSPRQSLDDSGRTPQSPIHCSGEISLGRPDRRPPTRSTYPSDWPRRGGWSPEPDPRGKHPCARGIGIPPQFIAIVVENDPAFALGGDLPLVSKDVQRVLFVSALIRRFPNRHEVLVTGTKRCRLH